MFSVQIIKKTVHKQIYHNNFCRHTNKHGSVGFSVPVPGVGKLQTSAKLKKKINISILLIVLFSHTSLSLADTMTGSLQGAGQD
jgi:hypothetical protein